MIDIDDLFLVKVLSLLDDASDDVALCEVMMMMVVSQRNGGSDGQKKRRNGYREFHCVNNEIKKGMTEGEFNKIKGVTTETGEE